MRYFYYWVKQCVGTFDQKSQFVLHLFVNRNKISNVMMKKYVNI